MLEKFFIVIIVYVFGDKDTSNLSFSVYLNSNSKRQLRLTPYYINRELTKRQARLLSDRNEKRPRILPVQCKRTVNLTNKMNRFTPKPVNRYGAAG